MGIKIAQIVPYDPGAVSNGGVLLFVERLMSALLDNGIEVKLLGISYDKAKTDKANTKYEFHAVCQAKKSKFAAYKYNIGLMLKGRSIIKDDEIIHAHKVEHLLPFLKLKNPKILTLHINYFKEVFFRKNWIIAKMYAAVENYILKNAERFNIKRIVFVDKPTMEEYVKRFPLLKDISEVMPVGIEVNKFKNAKECRKKLNIKKGDKVILSVGRLVKEKDLSLAIRAYKKISSRETHMLIVGEGDDKERLMDIALDDKSIRFLGQIDNKEIPAMMKSSDLFVMSSLYEGTPTTILEAFATGIPVVATSAGGIKDIVTNRYNGEVVERNIDAFAAAMKRCLKMKAKNNCIKTAQKYSIGKISDRYIEIYKKEFNRINVKIKHK